MSMWQCSVSVVGVALVDGAAFLMDTPHLPENSLALFIKASRCIYSRNTVWAFPCVTEKKGKLKGSCNLKKTH